MFNYLSLRSRIAKLILNSLMIEKDTANTNMLLGLSYLNYRYYNLLNTLDQQGLKGRSSLVKMTYNFIRCIILHWGCVGQFSQDDSLQRITVVACGICGRINIILFFFSGGLSLFIQDMATYEYREQDKLSSDTSNISVDQYNLAVGGASDSASQSADSDQQDTPPEVILRKPSKKGKEDFSEFF